MKAIIAGGRDFDHFDYMVEVLNFVDLPITEVVSGKQVSREKDTGKKFGADYLGEKWASLRRITVREFPADWRTHGRSAGPLRNQEMADYADFLIAFWDGQSRGTKSMIDEVIKRKKPYLVFFY